MMDNTMNTITPVYLLTGFLGSGKTTLLQHMLSNWKMRGLRPAVMMNEIGEVNLDGLLVEDSVPMTELLGGCICCTVRGDLGLQLSQLITNEAPDVIVIEATGAANPMEIFDAVTEVSLYMKLDIKPMITVVDSAHFLELYKKQQGKTYRLMLDQIRCGSILIMNKMDLIEPDQAEELTVILKRLNPFAKMVPAVKCEIDFSEVLNKGQALDFREKHTQAANTDGDHHQHEHHHHHHRGSGHEHITVYTHYFNGPINSVAFEQFLSDLPREIYRGKGVLTFSDTSSRFLFQYAYREPDFLKITPQGNVPDVAVFIGEHFDKQEIALRLKELEE